jgi:hypothetical protein
MPCVPPRDRAIWLVGWLRERSSRVPLQAFAREARVPSGSQVPLNQKNGHREGARPPAVALREPDALGPL